MQTQKHSFSATIIYVTFKQKLEYFAMNYCLHSTCCMSSKIKIDYIREILPLVKTVNCKIVGI